MAEETLFVGNAKVRNTNFGEVISVGFKKADLELLMSKLDTDSGFVNIDICDSRSGGKYCKINTYKKQAGGAKKEQSFSSHAKQETASEVLAQVNKDDDDLPF